MVGCRYGGPSDSAIPRNRSWFSYVGTANPREACGSGAANRHHFVYNRIYDEKIRSLEFANCPAITEPPLRHLRAAAALPKVYR